MLKLNPYAKTLHHSSLGQEPQASVGKATAALEAKSDEKVVPSKKPVVGKNGKKAVGLKKQKKPLVGKRLQLPRNQQPRRSPQKRNPPQKKRSLWHKLKFVYSIKLESLWTAIFELKYDQRQ
ncbi:60S ribosomal protein L4 [Myotis brandtii]|uniref:60S ribosomal protein L4 n=1 Tax=Myotis brandtii TaxID=109478 RepID=S7P0L7_MYOBR|nr:60S ribosomal protein L4 [Myotis brandtii]